MSCNSIIHDELKAIGNSICDVKLVDDIETRGPML